MLWPGERRASGLGPTAHVCRPLVVGDSHPLGCEGGQWGLGVGDPTAMSAALCVSGCNRSIRHPLLVVDPTSNTCRCLPPLF